MDIKSKVKAAFEDDGSSKHYEELPWKAWGSWFSWGSPVGCGIGFALVAVSSGLFVYLVHLAGLI